MSNKLKDVKRTTVLQLLVRNNQHDIVGCAFENRHCLTGAGYPFNWTAGLISPAARDLSHHGFVFTDKKNFPNHLVHNIHHPDAPAFGC
ncbi:hypothetical protein BAL199_18971 [alpha proteobacterium BAL199]|nr:hypothetical protein BAL199_18971 [alpha proteobacterium BAL199]